MDSIKNAGNAISEKVQQAASGTSKEANKEVAKDGNAPIGTRYVLSPASPHEHITNRLAVPPLPRTPLVTRPRRRSTTPRAPATSRPSKLSPLS